MPPPHYKAPGNTPTDNGSNWSAIATTGLADDTALYLNSSTKLRFLPAANYNGTPGALTTRLIDNSADIPAASSINPFGLTDVGSISAPVFADIDGDGDLDAFIGNNNGNTVFFQNTGTSAAPDFSGGSTTNPFGLIDVGSISAPVFADIDGDGLVDAFIGDFNGNTIYFKNNGTSATPDFSGGPTTNPFGLGSLGGYAAPDFVDIDGDGDLDAFIGNNLGTTVFFHNTGTSTAPDFSRVSTTTPFGLADVGSYAAPDFVDIDGDGDLDAFIGNHLGNTVFFYNTGTSSSPDFSGGSTTNPFGISDVGSFVAPVFADIDGNGLLDAFIGNGGGNTVFFQNTGTSAAPAFAAGFAGGPARADASTVDVSTNGDTTDISAATLSLSTAVTAVNDAPVASGSPSLAAISEESTDPAGDTVANLFSSSFSDVDGDSLVGIAITANAATASQGAWQYSTDNGSNWTAIATTGLADDTALYLNSSTKLRFLPAANYNGTPGALTTRLIDNSADIPAASSINPFGLADAANYIAPDFVDIDGDGDLDAFIGNNHGNTVFFQNTGTSAAPDFSGGSTNNPFGLADVGFYASPDYVDIDGDGDLDAFIGNSVGNTVFFLNTGTSAAPDFSGGSTTKPFGLADVGDRSTPVFADIDADGDLDAFIGQINGTTVFFLNTGTSAAPDFSGGSTTSPFGISDVGTRAAPDFVDIDGDGDLDAFIGDTDGTTAFFNNTGTSAAPDFTDDSTANPFGISNVGLAAAPVFADIDGDGLLDAFIGDRWGNTVFFHNTGTSSAPAFAAGFAGRSARANASTIDVSTNGNTTDISAATLSLSTAVTAVNDSPTITGAGSTLAFTEGDGATVIDSSLTITDADDTNIESATVSISSGFQSAEDVLAFSDTSSISGSWNASTGVLTLTGSDTLANYKDALESVTYNNTSDNPNTASRTISWVVNDGDTNSSAVTSTITVTAVNDAPVASGSPSLAAISEDSITPAGDTVANLFSSSFSDVDGDSLVGIAITANAATASQGAWQYSTDNGSNWTAIATTGLADATALYLATDVKLRFLPAANYNGTPGALTTRLIDNSADIPAASSINPFGLTDVGSVSEPVFADIDADGDLDAFIGNREGNTVFFHNTGTSAAPDFSGGSTNNPFGAYRCWLLRRSGLRGHRC